MNNEMNDWNEWMKSGNLGNGENSNARVQNLEGAFSNYLIEL